MNEVKDALLRMVKTTLFLKRAAEAYTVIGLDDNPHHEAYGNMFDAIYSLIGEHVDEMNLSITYVALTAPFLSAERRTELLMTEYEKNHPNDQVEQPKPFFFSPEEMRRMKDNRCAYQTPEGDWK